MNIVGVAYSIIKSTNSLVTCCVIETKSCCCSMGVGQTTSNNLKLQEQNYYSDSKYLTNT